MQVLFKQIIILYSSIAIIVVNGSNLRTNINNKKNRLATTNSRSINLQTTAENGNAPTGKLHRCKYTGPPDHLDDYLTQKQLNSKTDLYYQKRRTKGYFQHLFVEKECTNGLPGTSNEHGSCVSTLRIGQQCGPDEDWSIIAPDEFDGPGVMWRNDKECDPNVHNTNITVSADFFCPVKKECIHVHRCSFAGEGTPVTEANTNTNQDIKTVKAGYFEHVFEPEECSNGLPPKPSAETPGVRCVTSMRWKESCGGDHDWEAFSPGEGKDGKAKVRWYTSHTCEKTLVAVDYYCSLGPSGLEMKRRLHRCTFKGKSDVDKAPKSWCEARQDNSFEGKPKIGTHPWYGTERHAGTPPPGFCMIHEFKDEECTNNLPPKNAECLVATHRLKECGAEQDFHIIGPGDKDSSGMRAGIRWYNGLETGPCGDADFTIDYYCDTECVRKCENGGKLIGSTCSCKCNQANQNAGKTFWTGVECQICGAKEEKDCSPDAGLKLDKKNCKCISADAPVPAKSDGEIKKAKDDQEGTIKKLAAAKKATDAMLDAVEMNQANKKMAESKAKMEQEQSKVEDEMQNMDQNVEKVKEIATAVETAKITAKNDDKTN